MGPCILGPSAYALDASAGVGSIWIAASRVCGPWSTPVGAVQPGRETSSNQAVEMRQNAVKNISVPAPACPADGPVPPRRRPPHRRTRPQLLTRAELDGRTNAAKAFDRLVSEIEADLGGRDQLSAIELTLIEGYAGAAVALQDMNARRALGQPIDLAEHSQVASTMVRIASRLGLRKRMRDVTPSLGDILNEEAAE
jgi:hypothetical protein